MDLLSDPISQDIVIIGILGHFIKLVELFLLLVVADCGHEGTYQHGN